MFIGSAIDEYDVKVKFHIQYYIFVIYKNTRFIISKFFLSHENHYQGLCLMVLQNNYLFTLTNRRFKKKERGRKHFFGSYLLTIKQYQTFYKYKLQIIKHISTKKNFNQKNNYSKTRFFNINRFIESNLFKKKKIKVQDLR